MKTNKFISAVMAVAMVATTMTTFSAFAVDDPDVTGNSMDEAEEISFNEIIESEFSKTDSFGSCDHDWYKFSLDTPGKLNLWLYSTLLYSTGTTEPTLEIIDADNDDSVVYKFNRFESNNTLIIYLTAGNYYIHLASNNRSSTGTYKMRLINTPTEESFDSKSNNNIGDASPVEFDTTYTGQISVNDDADYYTFDLEEEGMVTFTFKGDIENVDWKIYNSDNKVVQSGVFIEGENDDSIYNKKSYVMTAGTFTLGITKNGESCGDYTLSLDYLKDYNNRTVSGVFACADITKDGFIDANDASVILSYYAYLSTGGKESDMNAWYKTNFAEE